jgi:hypothetical protein
VETWRWTDSDGHRWELKVKREGAESMETGNPVREYPCKIGPAGTVMMARRHSGIRKLGRGEGRRV